MNQKAIVPKGNQLIVEENHEQIVKVKCVKARFDEDGKIEVTKVEGAKGKQDGVEFEAYAKVVFKLK